MKWQTFLAGALLAGAPGALAEDTTPPPVLDDAQIATVALTANTIDMDRGKWVLSRIKTDEVKLFANQMATDHEVARNEVRDLQAKLGVQAAPSAVSKQLEEGATKTMTDLKKLKGVALERAYINAEVAYHQAVIDAVNKVLIPQAKNADLKETLVDTIPTLEGHLRHARGVQALMTNRT